MTLATPDIDYLRELVAQQSGNVVAQRQVYLLEQRLDPIAKSLGLANVTALVGELRRNPNPLLTARVAQAVTVNETSFFRDAHLFTALQRTILPELIKKNETSKMLRIWSAACSSGQEPFSLAMVIRENFPQLDNWRVQIVGTDLSEKMLAKTKSGEYSQLEVNRGLPAQKLVRFFERHGSVWRAKPVLRGMIECRQLNLTRPWPFLGQFDMILIRNVLIYFDQATKADILRRAQRILRPDGYLFIGSAETVIGLDAPYQREEIDATVCYRPATGGNTVYVSAK